MVSAPYSAIVTTTLTRIVDYAPRRGVVHIQNNGIDAIRIGPDVQVTSASGFKIASGQVGVLAEEFGDNPRNPIFMVSESGSQPVNIWEVDEEERKG